MFLLFEWLLEALKHTVEFKKKETYNFGYGVADEWVVIMIQEVNQKYLNDLISHLRPQMARCSFGREQSGEEREMVR